MKNPEDSQQENGALEKLDEGHLLRTLTNLLPDVISVKDREGRNVWVNRAKLEELGLRDFKDAIGKTAFDFFDRATAENFKQDDDQLLQTGQPVVNRLEKILQPHGTTRWHLTTKVPWRDPDGNIIGLISISRDITQRVEVEIRLEEERNLLRTLVDHLPDCIYAKDAQARKIMANPADLKNLGCKTEADAVGKTDFELFPREIAGAFFADDQSVLAGHSVINREEKAVLQNGETRWLLTSKIPWRDAEGKIIGLVGIGRDITDRKNLEAQVAQAQRMESIGRLATGIAHDLNNILAPILISIEMLRDKLQDEDYLKMLAKAEASAHRGADIIKQMLWLGRGLASQRAPVDLEHIISNVAQFASETFKKSIKVQTQIAPELWTITGDTAQLHQVLLNLCTNARDAMPDGGTLTLGAHNSSVDGNRFVVLEVADTGIGIAPELLERIFEPFFTTKEVGQGLGLSSAVSIVKSHHGFIKPESKPGHGTTFRVHLPAQT